MRFFYEFGSKLANKWELHNFDEAAFPAMASDALHGRPPAKEVNYKDVVEWVQTTGQLPHQPTLRQPRVAGQPLLTVYWHPRFRVDLLFWTTSTAVIHQHAFCGAFGLLEGTSVISEYDFNLRRRVSNAMRLGDLVLRKVRLLRLGDVELIPPGEECIHTVFHLDFPSVSILVRTTPDRDSGPTNEYYRPHLCLDAFHVDANLERRCQLLKMLRITESSEYERIASLSIKQHDLLTSYRILEEAWIGGDFDLLSRLVAVAESKHGEDVQLIKAVLEERNREILVSNLRRSITSWEHRFFLALLMVLPDRSSIFTMIKEHFPDVEAKTLVSKWCHELSGATIGIEFDGVNRFLVEEMLNGSSTSELETKLAEQYGQSEFATQKEEILLHCEKLRNETILRPLLCEA